MSKCRQTVVPRKTETQTATETSHFQIGSGIEVGEPTMLASVTRETRFTEQHNNPKKNYDKNRIYFACGLCAVCAWMFAAV